MCPEPDFCIQYRELIAYYRLTPEASARQLDAILRRFQENTGRKPPPAAHQPEKGSEPS